MSQHRVWTAALSALAILVLGGCYKPLNLEQTPIPGNTLVLEFAAPIRYSMDLFIDGKPVPIKFSKRNKRLWIEGLTPGEHNFNIHSISYVFGPEFDFFRVDEQKGAYFFIQLRKYRSALPKERAQVSIKAYRRQLRKQGVDLNAPSGDGQLRASFTSGRVAPPVAADYKQAQAEAKEKERALRKLEREEAKEKKATERARKKAERERKRAVKKQRREEKKKQKQAEVEGQTPADG